MSSYIYSAKIAAETVNCLLDKDIGVKLVSALSKTIGDADTNTTSKDNSIVKQISSTLSKQISKCTSDSLELPMLLRACEKFGRHLVSR